VNQPDPDRPVGDPARHAARGHRRPVCGHARLRAASGVELREREGVTELFDPTTGASHRLSRAAAELWVALDGRPLREIRPVTEAETTTECDVDLAVIELVRRFKALGLVEDLP